MAEQQILNELLEKFGVDREWIEKVGSSDQKWMREELERKGVTEEEFIYMSCWWFVERGEWEYVGEGEFRIKE